MHDRPAAPSADAGAADPWPIATHYRMPARSEDSCGPVVSAPVFTAITFAGYDITRDAETLVGALGATAYWASAVREYGVGAATATSPIELSEGAPSAIDDRAIQTWLVGKLEGSTSQAAFVPTSQSVYVLFYPNGTTVTLNGMASCISFGGYHNTIRRESASPPLPTDLHYVVIPECMRDQPTSAVSIALSHELIESVTDPEVYDAPAYSRRGR